MSDLSRLKQFFSRRVNRTVGLPTLGKVMSPFSVTKRISELRKRGFVIDNTTTRLKGGAVKSVYICREIGQ